MTNETIRTITEQRLVAVIRLDDVEQDILPLAEALVDGGVKVLELTLTGRGALPALRRLGTWAQGAASGDIVLGVGSVRRPDQARAAVDAGAAFIVSPGLVPRVLELERSLGVPVVPGVLTPSEALAAEELGADAIKLFPASLGGPAYLKNLLAPLPDLKLIPTGGINLDEIPAYLDSGAAAVGLGGSLVSPDLVAHRRWGELRQRAQKAVKKAHEAS